MREIRTSGLMSGDGKRSTATAPVLDSTRRHVHRGSESAKVLLQQSLAAKQRRSPMPTQCTPARFDFPRVEGRAVVAAFDGGRITTDAGALLLGATDRVLGLTRRFAACFRDSRDPGFVEHSVETLLMQRIIGIALGYEDLVDHDELRHDPLGNALQTQGKLEDSAGPSGG